MSLQCVPISPRSKLFSLRVALFEDVGWGRGEEEEEEEEEGCKSFVRVISLGDVLFIHLNLYHSKIIKLMILMIYIFFLLFFPEKGFDISFKLFPLETICMKCQNPFSAKKKKIFQYVVC